MEACPATEPVPPERFRRQLAAEHKRIAGTREGLTALRRPASPRHAGGPLKALEVGANTPPIIATQTEWAI